MSRKASCWDNAVAESFFGSLKQELVQRNRFLDLDDANKQIADYILNFYNQTRLHSANLGGRSPNDTEAIIRLGTKLVA